jgi:hypothetical protein
MFVYRFLLFLPTFFIHKPYAYIKKLIANDPLDHYNNNKQTKQAKHNKMMTTTIESFWKSIEKNTKKPNQLQRYEEKNAPEHIKKFIAIGGGPKMGIILEKYARFQFSNLAKRKPGKEETGYDHILKKANGDEIFIEQKSSGHWGEDDFKWQHVEENHKWQGLLLCGITYTHVRFWIMDRATFVRLIEEKKITNQGNKAGNSSEGKWFSYSVVKDCLKEVTTEEDLENLIL